MRRDVIMDLLEARANRDIALTPEFKEAREERSAELDERHKELLAALPDSKDSRKLVLGYEQALTLLLAVDVDDAYLDGLQDGMRLAEVLRVKGAVAS